MHESLRQRIMSKLETLPEERVYQIMDYIDFLESKYAARTRDASTFQRIAEEVEDTLRASRVSASAIAGTMGVVNKAVGVLSDVATAGKSVAADVVSAVTGSGPAKGGGTPPASAP